MHTYPQDDPLKGLGGDPERLAAIRDAMSEDDQLAALRAEFAGQWSVTVCDGAWEARPLALLGPSYAITAGSSWELADKLYREP